MSFRTTLLFISILLIFQNCSNVFKSNHDPDKTKIKKNLVGEDIFFEHAWHLENNGQKVFPDPGGQIVFYWEDFVNYLRYGFVQRVVVLNFVLNYFGV